LMSIGVLFIGEQGHDAKCMPFSGEVEPKF